MLFTDSAIRSAAASLERKVPPPGKLIDIGGRRLHIFCEGTGTPTVVLDSGRGVNWADWQKVQPAISRFTRVCVYDRAGYGWSDPGPEPRTALAVTEDLHTLITRAGIPRPFVLVGHSFSGLTGRLYAARYPGELAGLVLVDPNHEDDDAVRAAMPQPATGWRARAVWQLDRAGLTPAFRRFVYRGRHLRGLWTGNAAGCPPQSAGAMHVRCILASSEREYAAEKSERDSRGLSESQVRDSGKLGDLPLMVISGAGQKNFGGHLAAHARIARLSTRGEHILADKSGHWVQLDQPELVNQAIHRMVLAARQ